MTTKKLKTAILLSFSLFSLSLFTGCPQPIIQNTPTPTPTVSVTPGFGTNPTPTPGEIVNTPTPSPTSTSAGGTTLTPTPTPTPTTTSTPSSTVTPTPTPTPTTSNSSSSSSGSSSSSSGNFQVDPNQIAINSFSQTTFRTGDTITIHGTNFSTTLNNNVVQLIINGVIYTATIISATSTKLVILIPTIPNQTTSLLGEIKLIVNGQTAVNNTIVTFSLLDPNMVPIVNSISSTTIQPNTTVTITGNYFSSTLLNNIVNFKFGDLIVQGEIISATLTQLVVRVPNVVIPSGTSGTLQVFLNGITATFTNTITFTIINTGLSNPVVTNISPTTFKTGQTVTITGTNFTSSLTNIKVYFIVNGVTFEGTIVSVNDNGTQIVVTVPEFTNITEIINGILQVLINGINATSSGTLTFTLQPSNGTVTVIINPNVPQDDNETGNVNVTINPNKPTSSGN